MNGRLDFTFRCPDCGESVAVNPPMREALLDYGCVVCGTALSPAAFTADRDADGTSG
jgi:predicted RNA-binding Zn-ribbon protein involved in translation (DUF1610 family)